MNLRPFAPLMCAAALVACSHSTPPPATGTGTNTADNDRANDGSVSAIVHASADTNWNIWGCHGRRCLALNLPNNPLHNEDCVAIPSGYDSFRVEDANPERNGRQVCYAPFEGSVTIAPDGDEFVPEAISDNECQRVTILRPRHGVTPNDQPTR